MEIEIAEWDFSLGRCNNPIPFVTFVPTMDFLELAARNNNEVWVTLSGTQLEEYDNQSFKGVVDVSMANNPCKADLSSAPCYYTLTFPDAPYSPSTKGGKFFINKPITAPPRNVLEPVENYQVPPPKIMKRQDANTGMDATSLAMLGAVVAIAFGIALMCSTSEN